uniref:Uncharacterized protein n=1 Tax=Setaria italica TaxID=4555 RepID=K4AHQ5_SETIT
MTRDEGIQQHYSFGAKRGSGWGGRELSVIALRREGILPPSLSKRHSSIFSGRCFPSESSDLSRLCI